MYDGIPDDMKRDQEQTDLTMILPVERIMPPCKLDFAGHEFLMVFCPRLDKIIFWNFW